MAETVTNGVSHVAEGVLPSVRPGVPASWDWKAHLRKFPKYAPIVSHAGQPVGLSFGELRVWVVSNAESGSVAYNVPVAWRLTGAVNADALTWSLNQIVARHEALRTCYRHIDGQLVPCVTEGSLVVVTADLWRFPEAERESELQRRIREEVRRPFDLSRDLMLHAALLRLAEHEHVLILTVHHIAADGPAMGVLLGELSHLYSAAVTGVPPALDAPRMQGRDFTRWQREALTEDVKKKQLAYWKEQLKGVPVALELPSDCPRTVGGDSDGRIEYLTLSEKLSADFKALSRRCGVTTFMGLLAAYQALLYRYSGQPDIVVGAAMTHRTRDETSKSIGFFSNMMALRTQFHDDPTFRDLLKRVRGVSLGAYAHQDVPFEAVVAELKPERAPGRNPLFQALLNYEDATWYELHLVGIRAIEFPVHTGTAKFDLSLCVVDRREGLQLSLEYNCGILEAATARRMLASFEVMAQAAVADADCHVSQLPLMTEATRSDVLSRWNPVRQEYPQNACIHELIEEQVRRAPEAVAFEFDRFTLSYQELNRRANYLARHLLEIGVGPEVLVGICAERSVEMVVAMIAVLKAGGAYVPLNPAHPPERRLDVIRSSGSKFLITYKAAFDPAELPADLELVSLDDGLSAFAQKSGDNLPQRAQSNNLAYIIYTSGSTGRPKGVQIEHRAIVNFFAAMWASGTISADDVVLALTTTTFDISVLELLLPLTMGCRVVIANQAEVTDGRLLIEALDRSSANVLQATPTSWRMLIAAGWKGSARLKAFTGGEPLSRGLANELLSRCASLFNMYGLTETGVWSSMHRVEVEERHSVSIGRPIANNRFYILDPHQQPVPFGVAGELYIGGDGLSRGYLNAEELTRERFVPDPFSAEAGARMYRTGDLVRQREDGAFQYLSRTDRQVKVRGHRIELGEVESVVAHHPGVSQATVAACDEVSGGKRLVAYVVPKSCPTGPDASSRSECEETLAPLLRAFLRERLPEYMVPSAFVILDVLPLTSSGKIDAKALPAPDNHREEAIFSAPRDPVEQRVAEIWEESLKVSPVSITDNFFDLGGHSVLGATMLTRVEQAFGKRLSLATLFQAPTVEHLSSILRQDEWVLPWLVQVQPGKPSKPPLFFVQARMGYRALAMELGPDQPVYAVPYDRLYENQTDRTMQDIATELSEKIRSVQPHGPYYLGGVCLAGRVAYAIAREMYRQGEEVALLAVFDSAAPGYERRSRAAKLRFRAGHLKWHLQRFVHGNSELKRAFLVELRWHLINRLWWTGNSFFRLIGRPLPGFLRQQFRLTARAAITDGEVVSYPGHVLLFRPVDRPKGSQDDLALGWKKIAVGGVEVFEVPGDHKHVLLPPNVSAVAKELGSCLRRAS